MYLSHFRTFVFFYKCLCIQLAFFNFKKHFFKLFYFIYIMSAMHFALMKFNIKPKKSILTFHLYNNNKKLRFSKSNFFLNFFFWFKVFFIVIIIFFFCGVFQVNIICKIYKMWNTYLAYTFFMKQKILVYNRYLI